MKCCKIGHGKYYCLLFPNNRSISRCAVFDKIHEAKLKENKGNWMTRSAEQSAKIFPYRKT